MHDAHWMDMKLEFLNHNIVLSYRNTNVSEVTKDYDDTIPIVYQDPLQESMKKCLSKIFQ